MDQLRSIKGKVIAITGKCWVTQEKLAQKIRAKGGKPTPKGRVNWDTDVLVVGQSERWKFGDHGQKEHQAAEYIKAGSEIVLVHDDEFKNLIEDEKPARCSDTIRGTPIAWLRPPEKPEYDGIAELSGPLDTKTTANGRKEQAYLRAIHIGSSDVGMCNLCGIVLPTDLLIAAHIKPRSECEDTERRDARNIAFALCSLGCDSLYEHGYIAVNEEGKVVTVTTDRLPNGLTQALQGLGGRVCHAWRKETEGYFSWHFGRRFRGSE